MTYTPAEAMHELRAELRRSLHLTRPWLAVILILLAWSPWLARDAENPSMYWTAGAMILQLPVLLSRWWPVERALHRTRSLAEAVPVEVITPRWGDRTTVRTPQGDEWRWAAQPARVFSACTPTAGAAAWVAELPASDPRPTILVVDESGRSPRPRVCVSLFRATRLTPETV